MMINKIIAVFMVAALLGAGAAHADEAATAGQSASVDTASAPAARANLYIFRKHAEPIAVGADVSVDGVAVAEVRQKRYTAIYVPPGDHKITLDWPKWSGQDPGKIDLTVREGTIHYLEITGTSRLTLLGPSLFALGSGVSEIDPAIAGDKLKACCKYRPPLVVELSPQAEVQ